MRQSSRMDVERIPKKGAYGLRTNLQDVPHNSGNPEIPRPAGESAGLRDDQSRVEA
jgi:hypothetical protein